MYGFGYSYPANEETAAVYAVPHVGLTWSADLLMKTFYQKLFAVGPKAPVQDSRSKLLQRPRLSSSRMRRSLIMVVGNDLWITVSEDSRKHNLPE